MVVCSYFLRGNCRYGNNCRNEHPVANQNRFGVFGAPSGGSPANSAASTGNTYDVRPDGIVLDLTEERPPWIFSAYGPGRNAPAQLFGGAQTEQSFEELRLHYYNAVAAGNPQAAINDIDTLYRQIQQQMETAVRSPQDAVQFVLDAAQKHPNRLDNCKNNSLHPLPGVFEVGKNRSGQPQPPALLSGTGNGGFGQPSQLGAANPFATSSASTPAPGSLFGRPAGGSAFGQPSQLGGGPGMMGTPSLLGGTTSAFEKPAAPVFGQAGGGAGGFGQPSTLGQKPAGFGAFGQPSSLGQKPAGFGAFGQPSQLGSAGGGDGGGGGFSKFAAATPTGGSAFGQSSPFGAASAASATTPAPASGFGAASTFGQPASLGPSPSPFAAATAAPTTNNAPASPFGQPANGTAAATTTATVAANPFAAPSPAATNVFAKAAQPAAPANPFASASTPSATAPSPFGQPNTSFPKATTSLFAQPAPAPATSAPASTGMVASHAGASDTYGPQATKQHPALETYAQRDPANPARLKSFKGRPVTYETSKDPADNGAQVPMVLCPGDGKPAKVWFPGGAPAYNADTEAQPRSLYTAAGSAIQAQYDTFAKTGRFAVGQMPETPPLREWCRWDF
ncbi:hypothetical protein SEPCBS119000_004306 [Sporothrix epigloea]|uniref:C3H1-type domain-containing protein n=1 Tax=Sporothrix epigloea TaxID=1892477 RepID=A0ABP0DRD3_9PEZI